MNAKKWLSDNKTIVIIAAIIVAIVATLWAGKKIYTWIASKINESKIRNDSEEHTGTSITNTLQFKLLVERIFDAVYRLGTNEDEIYNVLAELRTQADWECIKRTWSSFYTSLPRVTQVGLQLGGTYPTLIGTFQHELNAKEIQRCRDILTDKGITPDF